MLLSTAKLSKLVRIKKQKRKIIVSSQCALHSFSYGSDEIPKTNREQPPRDSFRSISRRSQEAVLMHAVGRISFNKNPPKRNQKNKKQTKNQKNTQKNKNQKPKTVDHGKNDMLSYNQTTKNKTRRRPYSWPPRSSSHRLKLPVTPLIK